MCTLPSAPGPHEVDKAPILQTRQLGAQGVEQLAPGPGRWWQSPGLLGQVGGGGHRLLTPPNRSCISGPRVAPSVAPWVPHSGPHVPPPPPPLPTAMSSLPVRTFGPWRRAEMGQEMGSCGIKAFPLGEAPTRARWPMGTLVTQDRRGLR